MEGNKAIKKKSDCSLIGNLAGSKDKIRQQYGQETGTQGHNQAHHQCR